VVQIHYSENYYKGIVIALPKLFELEDIKLGDDVEFIDEDVEYVYKRFEYKYILE
jgi:hypothetical protein